MNGLPPPLACLYSLVLPTLLEPLHVSPEPGDEVSAVQRPAGVRLQGLVHRQTLPKGRAMVRSVRATQGKGQVRVGSGHSQLRHVRANSWSNQVRSVSEPVQVVESHRAGYDGANRSCSDLAIPNKHLQTMTALIK